MKEKTDFKYIFGSGDENTYSIMLEGKAKDSWKENIEPLIKEHWPQVRKEKFYKKFRLGSQLLYAWGGYTILIMRKTSRLSNIFIPLIGPFFRILVPKNVDKKIILASAFNTLLDEALDSKRCSQREILEFLDRPKKPCLKLLKSFIIESGAPQQKVRSAVAAWVNQERLNDGKRDKGIKASMDLLGWAVSAKRNEKNLMIQFADIVQSIDDIIDLEYDKRNSIVTPATLGKTNLKLIIKKHQSILDLIPKGKENLFNNKLNQIADYMIRGRGA